MERRLRRGAVPARPHSVALTEAGEALLPHARRVLEAWDAGRPWPGSGRPGAPPCGWA
nr:hypothetical protein [Streptomyces sp. TRM70350]